MSLTLTESNREAEDLPEKTLKPYRWEGDVDTGYTGFLAIVPPKSTMSTVVFQDEMTEPCRDEDTDLVKCTAPGTQSLSHVLTLKLVFPNTASRR